MNRKRIFGVSVNYGKYSEFLNQFVISSKLRKSSYVLFMNSHMLHEYHKKDDFQPAVQNADIICPDGTPLLYSFNLLKGQKSERIAGNDVIFSMVDEAEKNQLRVFFYGSTQEVLDKISARIQKNNPSLIFETYSPPFNEGEESDLESHIKLINDFNTNILFVGLGCPKQEARMHRFHGKVNALMLGVGGAFLLFAGIDSRAPYWMRRLSLEWLYRLTLEPKRLFKRYLITNTYFCWLFIKEVFKRN